MENKTLVAYTGDEICDRKDFFNNNFYLRILRIKEIKIYPRDITIVLEKPNGQSCDFQLGDGYVDSVIRHFYSDMGCYDIFKKPRGDYVKPVKNLKKEELEVFFNKKRNVPVAISPVFR